MTKDHSVLAVSDWADDKLWLDYVCVEGCIHQAKWTLSEKNKALYINATLKHYANDIEDGEKYAKFSISISTSANIGLTLPS